MQVPVPPKKPAKAKAQAEMEAAKAEVPKPDISEVERMIEQEGGGGAPKPRDTDDVFAAVPNVKADKKNKRKDRRDKKKKVLDVEFGERRAPSANLMLRRRVALQRRHDAATKPLSVDCCKL